MPHSDLRNPEATDDVTTAKKGDTVQVHYTGRLSDGTVFDTSRERDPIEFTLGEGDVIAGFAQAVEGMEEGETTEAKIAPEDAYGTRSEDLVVTIPREQLPQEIDPDIGQGLEMQTAEGQKVPVTVTDTSDTSIQVDANHPLAGKDLTFDLELVKIG